MNKLSKFVNKSEYLELMSNINTGRLDIRNKKLMAIDDMANFMSFDLLLLFDDVDLRELKTTLMVIDVNKIINENGIRVD
jgi:hypothetical protein